MRRVFIPIAACVVAILSVGGPPAQAAPPAAECQIHLLPVPAATVASEVSAGDPGGRWLAGTVETPDGATVSRWHDGAWSSLKVPVENVSITGVNRRGDLVGFAPDAATGGFQAFAVVGGNYVKLTALGATSVSASGISRHGRVSGYERLSGQKFRPLRWDVEAPDDPAVLKIRPDYNGFGMGISATGQVAVVSRDSDLQHWRSYTVAPSGKRRALPPTARGLHAPVSTISSEYAAGTQFDPDQLGVTQVVRWDLATRTPVAITSDLEDVNSINSAGVIGGQQRDGQAALIIGTETIPLPALAREHVGSVATVADTGVAAGFSHNDQDRRVAVTWTC